jgi:LysM repeat protein
MAGLVAGQDVSAEAAALAAQREADERYKRLAATVEDLRDAYSLQQKRLGALADELHRLRGENSQLLKAQRDFATKDDLKKLIEKVQEVDHKRSADNKAILEELQKLGKVAAAPVEPKAPPVVQAPKEMTGEFYPHIVKPGESLSAIIATYNATFKELGKANVTQAQILKANPKLNPNKILAGQEILIPAPPNK